MLTTTRYFRDLCFFGILTILAAILAVLCRVAVTNAMRALLVLGHKATPILDLDRV